MESTNVQHQFFFINPAVSEANMVDTCKHFEIGSGSEELKPFACFCN
jgi:hypothetical protein